MNLALALPPRHQDALTQLLHDLYDPASPRYRQYLTPAQFAEQFGPTQEDYQALINFARLNGLKVTATHPNRVLLDVEGAVPDIERTFNITLRTYQHPTEGRIFHAPDVEPSVDAPVALLDISGLDDYSIPRPHLKRRPAGLKQANNATPNSGSGGSGGYAGGDFRAAYVPGTALTGAGQSVGLLQFDGYYASDIAAYRTQFNLPNIPLVNVAVDGGVSTPGTGNGEVCLDIEMVMSMAPGLSTIYVYEAPNPSPFVDLLSKMANDNLAKQLSCSWGGGRASAAAEVIFQQMASQGQSFFNATGDDDAFTGAITFPSESPSIIQVGATTLTTSGPLGNYVSETVWNWGNGTGSSGGVSTTYSIPTWQQGISMTANQGSTTKRNMPDVALVGDNVYVKFDNGSSDIFGGTSCAAPLWAGFMALVNQQAAANGTPAPGFINPTLYAIGKGASYTANFHDTTTGNNFSSSSPSKYSAVAGYDLCTGWGTPVGPAMITSLAGPFVPTITGFTPASGVQGTSVTITGTNFNNVSKVSFNGVSAAFTVNSGSQITATLPATASTGPIAVTTPGGTATSAASFTFIPGPPVPVITSFSPGAGFPAASVVITGNYFSNATSVTFGGGGAVFTVNSDTMITATVPGSASTGAISVTTASGTSSSSQSFVVLTGNGAPTITSFTPTTGSVGDSVTITGTNFVNISTVTFNGASASFTVNSDTQITATVPANVTSGPITVTSSLGSATSSASFSVVVSPIGSIVISQIYPTGGSTGSTYANDFIELYNKGTQPVSLTGCSVQYALYNSSLWNGIVLSGTMLPGHYLLVKCNGGSVGAVLPTPDATMSLSLNTTRGKVAVIVSTDAISVRSPVGLTGLVDFVGYGSSNTVYQGAGPAPTPSGTLADLRLGGGTVNTNDNAADFVTGPPLPRNSAYAPDLTIASTHSGNFTQADLGDTYTLTVTNAGTAPTSGAVSVADILPSGLTATALSGTGWTIDLATLTATRSNVLAAGQSYPPLTLTVNVASNAAASVANAATVSGGGETNTTNNTASDPTTINPLTPLQSWREQWFGTSANSGLAADTAIATGDGLPNLIKYALNLPPLVPATTNGVITVSSTSGVLSLTVTKNPAATDITYTIESSSDLVNWGTSTIVIDQNTSTLLQGHDSTPPSSGQRFLHLKVTRP